VDEEEEEDRREVVVVKEVIGRAPRSRKFNAISITPTRGK